MNHCLWLIYSVIRVTTLCVFSFLFIFSLFYYEEDEVSRKQEARLFIDRGVSLNHSKWI